MRSLPLALCVLTFAALFARADTVDQLSLDDVGAFAIGTGINVHSVDRLDARALTDSLRAAEALDEAWTDDPLMVALKLLPGRPVGRSRSVDAQYAPGEWEPGRPFRWVRVTVVDGGWLDDSVTGIRTVFWLVPCDEGPFRVHRALRAHLCSRPYRRYYSADPCP